jgi:hypothetical protein
MKVFSFCLYGTASYYYTGLLENIRIIQQYYPDFSIIVYLGECDASWVIPDGVTVVKTGKAGAINAWIRYTALTFADIGFVRDTDSRITERDRWCIDTFLKSSYSYHSIRDHYWHKSPIMAGLFGWKRPYPVVIDATPDAGYGHDESELTRIYPAIVDDMLVHTNIYARLGEHSERITLPQTDMYDFVGNVYKNETPEFTYPFDVIQQVRLLQREDQFAIIRYITESVDPLSIPYHARSEFYDTCFIANYYLRDIAKCQYWLSKFEFAEITSHVIANSSCLFMIMNKRIVATFDSSREPTDNEMVIVYGPYPEWHRALPCSNKIYRHISLFHTTRHDQVEYNPAWEPIDIIYILNLEERVDRYYETLLTLASVGAPLHRVHHYKAKKDGLPPYVGATKNHVDVMEHFCASGLGTCLILEDDFLFIDAPTVHRSIADFFSTPREYDVTFLSLSKHGRREPYDALLGQSFQECTTSSGYLLHSTTAPRVYEIVLDGLNKMMETGNHHTYCVDRYWAKLSRLLYFRTKLGFQRPSYSNLTRGVSAHLD